MDSHIWLFMLKRFGGKRMQEKMDQWINWVEYDELLEGRHNAPHNLLDCTALAEVRFLRSTDLKLKEFL